MSKHLKSKVKVDIILGSISGVLQNLINSRLWYVKGKFFPFLEHPPTRIQIWEYQNKAADLDAHPLYPRDESCHSPVCMAFFAIDLLVHNDVINCLRIGVVLYVNLGKQAILKKWTHTKVVDVMLVHSFINITPLQLDKLQIILLYASYLESSCK